MFMLLGIAVGIAVGFPLGFIIGRMWAWHEVARITKERILNFRPRL